MCILCMKGTNVYVYWTLIKDEELYDNKITIIIK